MKHKMHMPESHHMSHEHMSHEHGSHGIYKNEVERPAMPPFGHISASENIGMGMHEWKGEADPIAYGQASKEGCASDNKKIHSQFKDYHWD
jgi:hypothetical protein